MSELFRSFPCNQKGCTGIVLEGYVYCGAHGGRERADREFRARERQARNLLSPKEMRELARPEPRRERPRPRPQWDRRGAPVGTGLRGLAKRDKQIAPIAEPATAANQ